MSFCVKMKFKKRMKGLYNENLILKNQAERSYDENLFLKKQVDTLNEWVDSLKKERQAFEAMNLELNEIRIQHEKRTEKKSFMVTEESLWKTDCSKQGLQ